MFWHDAGRLTLEIGTPLAAVRLLTWLVALFGNERISKRAMSLLRRTPSDHKHPVRNASQPPNPSFLIFTPEGRKTSVAEVGPREFLDFASTGPEANDDPTTFRTCGPPAKATDLILGSHHEAQETVSPVR